MQRFDVRLHFPTEIEYWADEEAHAQPFEVQAKIEVSGGKNKDNPLDWRLTTKVSFVAKSNDKKPVAKGVVSYVGYFDVPEEIPEDEREEFVGRNGASVLFAATRELIANLSCRGVNGTITLQPLFFGKTNKNKKGEEIQKLASGAPA